MRAVIYARYSSNKQSATSIEDQVRVCQVLADRNGWIVREVYADPEVSGTLRNRPRLLQLIADAKSGKVDVVVAESLDRLARDLEDTSWIGKRLTYSGARIFTHAEGEICEMKIAVAGLLGSMYVKNLAQKTWRGLEGAVLAGRMAGGRTYGFDVYSTIGSDGRPLNGLLRINRSEAEIVLEIYRKFARGSSAIQIAKELNARALKAPRGGAWNASTIRGDPKKLVGILNNPLYSGQLVWNRRQWRKNPETTERRRTYRIRPKSEWVFVDLPDLRVIPDDLWMNVRQRLDRVARTLRTASPYGHRRPKHLLSGLIRCGECGANYVISGKDYYRCAGHKERGTCSNATSVKLTVLENGVLAQLQDSLLSPDLADIFVEEFNREFALLQSAGHDRVNPEVVRLSAVHKQIENIVGAIADGIPSSSLRERLARLEEEKVNLETRAKITKASAPIQLPTAGELISLYRQKVADLRGALSADDIRLEASDALRGLIDDVVIHPGADGTEVELVGDVARLSHWAANENSRPDENLNGCSITVVAGTGFEPVTFRL